MITIYAEAEYNINKTDAKVMVIMIYMDNAATTRMRPQVCDYMMQYLRDRYANPSSGYTFSQKVREDIDTARKKLAASINADDDEIYMTSGGTESDNWALKMAADHFKKGHIITTRIEHHAILRTCEYLEKHGFSVTYLDVNEYGMVNLSELRRAIRKDTFLISVMTANNEIGTIQPIEEIGRIAALYNIIFHTDAVQAYMHIPIDVKKMNISMMSTSAHKLNGPKGTGFLYVNRNVALDPYIHGGMQENGRRAGTENVAGICGMAKAVEIAEDSILERQKAEKRMCRYMTSRILNEIPFTRFNGHPLKRLSNNMNFSFRFADGATLLVMLDKQGICVSAGSACSTNEKNPSHVLKAIGLSDDLAYSTLRFTINESITRNEIDYVINCLKNNIRQLRENSESYINYNASQMQD